MCDLFKTEEWLRSYLALFEFFAIVTEKGSLTANFTSHTAINYCVF